MRRAGQQLEKWVKFKNSASFSQDRHSLLQNTEQ